jgi:hypothetical protein
LIEKRWLAYRSRDWPRYNHYRRKVKVEVEKAKRLWAAKHKHSSQGLWKIVNERRAKYNGNVFHSLRHIFPDFDELLAALTGEFENNFNKSTDVPLAPLEDKRWDFVISPEAVWLELRRLNERKASGPDNIPLKLLVAGAEFLSKPLSMIYNRSVETSTFPQRFKHANVYPIPKKKSPSLKDFRPISINSVLGKIFELLVLKEMKKNFLPLYGLNQHAYRPFGSTTSALVSIHDELTLALDQKDTIAVRLMCLDLSKAFDCLQHHRLVNYLNCKGIDHGFLYWLLSYFSSRSFQVKVHGRYGPSVSCLSGVPQGSVLGPFLFASFMGSIDFSTHNLKCIKYADDVTIIETIKSPQQITLSASSISSTFSDAGLFLNQSKCKELLFQRSVSPMNCIVSNVFTRVCSLRILGFIFNDTLTWNTQVSDVLSKASQRLYIIRCLKSILSKTELVLVYNALITTLFLYASPTYGNLPLTLLCKFDRFIKRAHRLICGCDCPCDSFPAIHELFAQQGLTFLKYCENNPAHPLHSFVPKRLPRSKHFAISFSATSRRLNSFFPYFCVSANSTS